MRTIRPRVCLAGVAWVAVAAISGSAQSEPGPLVRLPAIEPAAAGFDAASVNTNSSGAASLGAGTKGRTYVATNMPLRQVIATAFGVPGPASYRVDGGPEWLAAARFDIVATLPDGAPASQVPAMLRRLLEERFKLAVRTEIREAPMYALVLERRDGQLGPRLLRASIDCDAIRAAGEPIPEAKPGARGSCDSEIGGAILGRGQRLTTLARYLTPFAGRPVIDRTGLTGTFDFDLEAPELNAGPRGPTPDNAGGGIFTAIREQLGLKLEPIRGSVEYVVIDRVERPSEN